MAKRILMIEDDAPLAAMTAEYLEGAGFDVTTCPTAVLGLEQLSAASASFDALVLDL